MISITVSSIVRHRTSWTTSWCFIQQNMSVHRQWRSDEWWLCGLTIRCIWFWMEQRNEYCLRLISENGINWRFTQFYASLFFLGCLFFLSLYDTHTPLCWQHGHRTPASLDQHRAAAKARVKDASSGKDKECGHVAVMVITDYQVDDLALLAYEVNFYQEPHFKRSHSTTPVLN